jgi:hypothetical protein
MRELLVSPTVLTQVMRESLYSLVIFIFALLKFPFCFHCSHFNAYKIPLKAGEACLHSVTLKIELYFLFSVNKEMFLGLEDLID